MGKPGFALFLSAAAGVVAAESVGAAQELGTVVGEQKIAASTGGFRGALDGADHFGHALANVGDVDGDGLPDLAVGAPDDDDGGLNRGALWLLFLEADGTVRDQAKISSTLGGLTGTLDNGDHFGSAVAPLGDLDGDGLPEVAVGAELDDDGGSNRGAVWVLSLNADGSVAATRKISQTSGGFAGTLSTGAMLGCALAPVDDMDGDGIGELAVGASSDRDGSQARGAVWLLFLDRDGRVKRPQKISGTSGGFSGALHEGDHFGIALASLGDFDGNGTTDLAVGADNDDEGGSNRGAVWLLCLRTDGTVVRNTKLCSSAGLVLDNGDQFGSSVASPGDVDGDGTVDLAVGARFDDDGSSNRGAVWMLFLRPDGTLGSSVKISSTTGGFVGPLTTSASFGTSLAALGDLDGDHMLDMAVGVEGDDTGGGDRGAVWVLFLETVKSSTIVIRNGSGVNPVLLTATDSPVVGSTWEVRVDCRGFNEGVIIHLAVDRPVDGSMAGRLGERLIDWSRPRMLRAVVRHHGELTKVLYAVPADARLVGLPFYSQAHVTGRGGAKLTNALDGEFLR